MFYLNLVKKITIFLYALNLCGLVIGRDDLKDDNIDRGSRSNRGGLWFGPRLGKRSLRLVNDDNRQTFLRLLEAADALRYYYDQLSYESQADDPEMKVTKKVIFTPKLGRSVDAYAPVDFTPRLGRRLADDRVTPADQDNYRPEGEQMDRNKYFSPRLGRTMNFSPRLGRELSYGYIGLLVSISSGHLIFAADIAEYKNFAKKFVPGNVAEKLFEIVSQNNAKNKDNNAHEFNDAKVREDNIYSYEYEEEENPEDSWQFVQYPSKAAIRQKNLPGSEAIYDEINDANQRAGNSQKPKPMEVNVDEVVEKVRQKLLHDFQKNPPDLQKLLVANVVTPDFEDGNIQSKNTKKRKLLHDGDDWKQNQQNRPDKQKSKIERKDAQSLRFQQDDLPEVDAEGNSRIPKDQRQKSELNFEELNLNSKKNEKDTYEDYVMPKREDNIFVSEESMATTKQAQSLPRLSQRSKQTQWQDIFNYKLQNGIQLSSPASEQINRDVSVRSTNPSIYDDSKETTTALDFKAKTENLWYDYKDEPNPKLIRMDTKVPSKVKTKKLQFGTIMPTRETYKMANPNYYGQLPTVAEKYNFDEPIPEKDREREDLKPIGNPLAKINGRIKV